MKIHDSWKIKEEKPSNWDTHCFFSVPQTRVYGTFEMPK